MTENLNRTTNEYKKIMSDSFNQRVADSTGYVPHNMLPALERYMVDRIEPGSFLLAVLNNDLATACAHADDINQRHLFDLVKWIYNNMPSDCWGSPERVQAWLNWED